jgi:8-oxo-dGTP diphosphatase
MNTSQQRPGLAEAQITVDVVIFTIQDNALKLLLVQRSEGPFQGQWALPGGFLWDNETTRQAARRILRDKAGVGEALIEQLYTFDQPDRDPRGRIVSVAHYALMPYDRLEISESDTTESPTLHPALTACELAFDHDQIVNYAIHRLRSKLSYTNAAYSLLPERFTLTDLQRLYEIVNNKTFDKRNFRKKFLSLGLIEPTNELSSGGSHRPAQLHRFIRTEPAELDQSFF